MPDTCDNASSCCDPIFTVSVPHLPPPAIVYWNVEQCATAACPTGDTGDPVTKCVAANSYSSSVSQVDADGQAYAAALAQAQASLSCGIQAQLTGLLWELPALNLSSPVCACALTVFSSVVVSGDPDTIYNALLRIRGLVELMPYAHYISGANMPAALFLASNPAITLPVTHSTGANEYCLRITNGAGGAGLSVAACYFVNNQPTFLLPYSSQVIDYTFTVKVRGGSVVSLEANSVDFQQWGNVHNLIVGGGNPPIQVIEPYKQNEGVGGQFLQMDALSIF